MADSRIPIMLSTAGFNSLLVPEPFLENRGRMYEPQEIESEDPPVEIKPTFAQYYQHLNNPGGLIRTMTIDGTAYTVFWVPNITGSEMEAMRDLAIANDRTLAQVVYSQPVIRQMLEQYGD